MIFYYGANGELINKTPQYVFQGSSKANTIYFVCPTSPNNLINVAFRLPNGQSTPQALMTLTEDTGLSGVFDYKGKIYAMWKYDIPSAITTYAGDVKVQFYISSYGEVLSTETAIITVKKGVSNIEPEEMDTYQEVLDNIIRLYNDLNTNYQRNIDDNLNTKDKTFVGAINEVNDKIDELNIENLIDENGNNTGSITTVKDNDKNTGKGLFGAAFGTNNIMNAHHSLIAGIGNESVAGGQGSVFIAGGNNNKVALGLSSAIGHNLRINTDTPNSWQPKIGVGLYNKDVKQAVFIVGNGTSETDRKNALEVYYDGHAEVQTQGTTPNSISKVSYKHQIKFSVVRGDYGYTCKLLYISKSQTAYDFATFYNEVQGKGVIAFGEEDTRVENCIVSFDSFLGGTYSLMLQLFNSGNGIPIDESNILNFTDTVTVL